MELAPKLLFDEENPPQGKVTSLSFLKLTTDLIRKKLEGDQLARYRRTAIGHLLDVEDSLKWQGQCIHGLILRKVEEKRVHYRKGVSFLLGERVVEFTEKDFCLITGLKFGKTPPLKDPTDENCPLKSKYFPKKDALVGELKQALEGCDDEEDALKLAQVYFVERCLLGNEFNTKVTMGVLKLVEDQVAFNNFPWGTLVYCETHEGIFKALRPEYRRGVNKQDARKKGSNPKAGKTGGKAEYHMKGFALALQVWAYETLPALEDMGFVVKEEPTKYPRILNWQTLKTPMFNQIMPLYMQENVTIRNIVPTPDEMKKDYWSFGVEVKDKVEEEEKVDEDGSGSQKKCKLEEELHNLRNELKLCKYSNWDLTKRLESVESRHDSEITQLKKTISRLENSVVSLKAGLQHTPSEKEVSGGATNLRKRKYSSGEELSGQEGSIL